MLAPMSAPSANPAWTVPATPGATSYAQDPSNPLSWVSSAPTVSQVQNAPAPSAYAQALQTALAPQFAINQGNLNAQQAAMGTLTSGAGNYGQQQLTAQNNATYANALLPLIQQGYAQDAAASSQNAGATNAASNNYASALNAMLSQQQGQGFQAAQGNQQAANAYGLNAQQDSNQAYQQALAAMLGINATGLNTQGNILASGVGQQQQQYGTALGQGQAGGAATGYGYQPYTIPTGSPSYTAPSYNYGGSPDTTNVGTGGDNTAVNGDNFLY